MLAQLRDALDAYEVEPHPIRLSRFPASVAPALEPHADDDGIVRIPAVWSHRVALAHAMA